MLNSKMSGDSPWWPISNRLLPYRFFLPPRLFLNRKQSLTQNIRIIIIYLLQTMLSNWIPSLVIFFDYLLVNKTNFKLLLTRELSQRPLLPAYRIISLIISSDFRSSLLDQQVDQLTHFSSLKFQTETSKTKPVYHIKFNINLIYQAIKPLFIGPKTASLAIRCRDKFRTDRHDRSL